MASSSDDGSDAATLRLTIVALAISVAAMLLSTLQALLAYLQFDNSEVGRRRCSAEVMGKLWASRTTRKFKWREFRYQVFFEVPVFYTAEPGNTKGPLTRTKPEVSFLDRIWSRKTNTTNAAQDLEDLEVIEVEEHVHPIFKITGTESSCQLTMTPFSNDEEPWAVHTADDEGCSWIFLLDALQEQERLSRGWDKSAHGGKKHTILYLFQRKIRCWDFMPLNITKPFATTTICHWVEIVSMLGLVWVEFDVKKSILNAEGNGYMAKSEYMPGLGILTRFSRLGKPQHRENRMIPCTEIKKLCFGSVPSLFEDPVSKNGLQFGPGKLESCLARLLPELADKQRKLIAQPRERPLVFPYTFELLGMVAKSVHLAGSRFRRLPNPCAARWTPHLDFSACLKFFGVHLKSQSLGDDDLTKELQGLFRKGRLYGNFFGPTLEQKISAYGFYADAYNKLKKETYTQPGTEGQKESSHVKESRERYNENHLDMLDTLHEALGVVETTLRESMLEDVRQVLTLHFTAVLDQQEDLEKELEKATLDNPKEKILLDFYFKKIYPKVVEAEDWNGRASNGSMASDASTLCSNSDRRSAVWLALMFRLWSWMFLHDFNSEDRMIERSEFMDNRLPVYIS
ncbi:hypothetical protein HYFRA_00005288 [Hymenoscyphus fraxineus]|uniref:Modin n=1 Tax=Hymenoscyphus fraxineus TaxID=746836 RepID=A0A9N9LDK5_9HELO|nr:hypothetical protein HYFRA_00005288 [Hymenoscyphus fraxineus]